MLAPPQTGRPSPRRLWYLALGCGLLLLTYPLLTWSPSSASPEGEEPQPATEFAVAAAFEGASVAAEPVLAGPDPDVEPLTAGPAAVAAAPQPLEMPLAVMPEPSSAFADLEASPVLGRSPREVAALPILMYHHVNDLPRTVFDPYLRDLTVSVLDFRRQLDFLEASGAGSVSLAQLMGYLQGGELLPRRPVVLTFDDGYDDNYRFAYPLLHQYGMHGTFFVVANLVGKPGYMTWEQLREMQLNGMEIESHSLDHIDLSLLPRFELQRQLVESRRLLELNLLHPVRYLNYPSGRYSPLVITTAKAAGYEAAVTVNYGLVQQRAAPYELNRVRVKGADTIESLAAKITPTSWRYPAGGQFGR